ncbi:hypothetical protein CBS101457_006190 [Exobasidium rhododendri]|nr:hypothetical protein CBS101457_006190 [Exobasidium rhododendri]
MASLATKATKRLVSQHAKQFEPEDPFYEYWVDSKGKEKRRKRPPPPGLTKAEAQLLKKIARRAHYLDKGFNVCGLRFGWTAVIGLIPGAGDIADASLNYLLVLKPAKEGADLPPWVTRKMMTNNFISAGIGFIPIAGDIALAVFKANSRNAKLLEEYLRVLGEEHIAAGLPNLTPEPPALPGGATSQTPYQHPAQSAAKKNVRDHSDQQLGSSTNAQTPATTTTTTTGNGNGNAAVATDRIAQTQTTDKKKWYQGKH